MRWATWGGNVIGIVCPLLIFVLLLPITKTHQGMTACGDGQALLIPYVCTRSFVIRWYGMLWRRIVAWVLSHLRIDRICRAHRRLAS